MLLSAAWSKEFSLRHPIIYVLYGIVLAFVISLSLYYMLTAIKHAKQLGIESSKIKKVITTSATFSILPGLGIALGVVTLVVPCNQTVCRRFSSIRNANGYRCRFWICGKRYYP